MSRLEEITVGSTVKGILGSEPVTIVVVQWYGTAVLDVTYKDSHGTPGVTMLMRENEESLEVLSDHLPWSFDADGEQLKLAAELEAEIDTLRRLEKMVGDVRISGGNGERPLRGS